MKIAFIGGGNMATAMITGMLNKKTAQARNICVADTDLEKIKHFNEKGISVTTDNQCAVDFADFIFLTVKPQQYNEIISKLSSTKGKIFITVAPAVSIASVEKWCQAKVIRTMPNTPALVGEGVTAVCYGDTVMQSEIEIVKNMLSSFSTVYEVKENQMNDIVALSGSSPAYTYMLIEAVANHSAKCGIDFNIAVKMIAQTVLGSAKMVLESNEPISTLRERVCSKGGTTIKAVEKLNELGFENIIAQAMTACIKRANEMDYK